MPVPANASITASATAESRSALVASPGLAVWMAPSASLEQARNRRPVVEVDHGRRGAAGGDGVRLGVVADERRHLVAVLLQFRQYVRSDEPGCTGECHLHSRTASSVDRPLEPVLSRIAAIQVRGCHQIPVIHGTGAPLRLPVQDDMPVSREANPRLFVAGRIHGSLESPNLAGR